MIKSDKLTVEKLKLLLVFSELLHPLVCVDVDITRTKIANTFGYAIASTLS